MTRRKRKNARQSSQLAACFVLILGDLAPVVVVADHHETASSTDTADAYLRALEGGSLTPSKTTAPAANMSAPAAP